MKLSQTEYLLLKDLRDNGIQFGWDWPADYRYSVIINDSKSAEIIKEILEHCSIIAIGYNYMASTGVKKKRVRALRKLQNNFLVEGTWVGMGEGSMSMYGTRRTRAYEITPFGIQELTSEKEKQK